MTPTDVVWLIVSLWMETGRDHFKHLDLALADHIIKQDVQLVVQLSRLSNSDLHNVLKYVPCNPMNITKNTSILVCSH